MNQRELKQWLEYIPETGIFIWRMTRNGRVKQGAEAGMLGRHGYRTITVNKKMYRAHRLAWFYVYGVWPQTIDHINRNKADNRITNLREVTRAENQQNKTVTLRSKSGVKGVIWAPHAKKWRAQIGVNHKQVYLGYFDSLDDAAHAYKIAAHKYHKYNPVAEAANV